MTGRSIGDDPSAPAHPRFDARLRPGFSVRPEVVTWHLCVFAVVASPGHPSVYVARSGSAVAEFLRDLDAGLLDQELTSALRRPPRRTLRRAPRADLPGRLAVGVEHEMRVLDRTGAQVDVRPLIHGLGIDGVRADPTDPNAYRCPWGGVITCDGAEVELATPPIEVTPGFVDRVVASTESGRAAIEAVLPAGLRLDGFSTHINVSASRRHDTRSARRAALTLGPALMLALDRRSSPGLLVRPRPGRLELCGEHATGPTLRSGVALAVGGVLAVGRLDRQALSRLAVEATLEPAVERFGWYVDRKAFGVDLYEDGRSAVLRRQKGEVTAGDHLTEVWSLAVAALGPRASEEDLASAAAAVAGDTPLPCEVG